MATRSFEGLRLGQRLGDELGLMGLGVGLDLLPGLGLSAPGPVVLFGVGLSLGVMQRQEQRLVARIRPGQHQRRPELVTS